jgi:Ser/Thr protein kinase RdoA (MazF antagonist)
VKILPETPSLDFLRREAKDLLSTIRESDPEATLAQAQRVLAERYGFTSWTELKAEVERRRAADAAVDPELGSQLASAFGLGLPTGSMSQIAWSQTGEQWSLQTDRGRWRLRTLLPWITSESLEDAVRLRDAAVVQGVASPEPVRTPAGDLIVELGVQRWCADAWMDVGPAPVMPPSVALARRVGEILGTLHALALPTSAPINPWLTQRRSAEEWNRIVGVVRSRGADWAPALEDALPAILDLTSIEAEAAGEAPILCICDLSVRAGAGDEVVVVHWDFAGAFLPSCELALVLSGWGTGHDGSVNEPAVKALMDGYRSRAALLPKLDLSSFVADISAWLNWTAGRIGGALNGEDAEWRRREVLELRGLLANPRSRAHYEQILGASDAGG